MIESRNSRCHHHKLPTQRRQIAAFSLVEVTVASLVLAIAFLGATSFHAYANVAGKKADLHVTAARAGLLLCEAWRGRSGADTFDPVTDFSSPLGLAIETSATGPAVPAGMTGLGAFKITIDNIPYYATLAYQNISADLRALNVTVAWQNRGVGTGTYVETDKTFKISTYTDL